MTDGAGVSNSDSTLVSRMITGKSPALRGSSRVAYFEGDAAGRCDAGANGGGEIARLPFTRRQRHPQNIAGLVFHGPSVRRRAQPEPLLEAVIEIADRHASHRKRLRSSLIAI